MISRLCSSMGGISALFAALSVLVYAVYNPLFVQAGDTVLGLIFGVVSGLLVLKLMMLGIKKTVLIARLGSYKQWVDAHNYIGMTLLIVSCLHAGFQFEANIHGFVLLLLLIMVLTGLVGTISYAYFPKQIEMLSPWLDADEATKNLKQKDNELLLASSKVGTTLNKLMWDLVQDTDYELSNNSLITAVIRLVKENRNSLALMDELKSVKPLYGAANASELEYFNLAFKEREVLFNRLRQAAVLSLIMSGWRWLHKLVSRLFFLLLILHVIIAFMY